MMTPHRKPKHAPGENPALPYQFVHELLAHCQWSASAMPYASPPAIASVDRPGAVLERNREERHAGSPD
jgi:hypothetical protein